MPPQLPTWKELASTFDALTAEQPYTPRASAMGDYGANASYGKWIVHNCIGEALKVRVELAIASAGKSLGCAPGVPPLDNWLDRLSTHLQANRSVHVRAAESSIGPLRIIEDVCVASSIYCARLQRAEIEGDVDQVGMKDLISLAVIEGAFGSGNEEANEEVAVSDATQPLLITPVPPVNVEQPRIKAARRKRTPSTINSQIAARRMEEYLTSTGETQAAFARRAGGTTERTIRTFKNTGKVRKNIFRDIAAAMGKTTETLLKPEDPGQS